MKANARTPRMTAALTIALACALPAAHAATDNTGQSLTLTAAPDETSITVRYTPPDQFSPAPPCNQINYTMAIYNDSTLAASLSGQMLTDAAGNCFVERSILSGAVYTNKVSPGVWTVIANEVGRPSITETLPIYACSALQGKSPMYWVRHSAYTDNFYTQSASQRNTALGIGYRDRGVPFSMPSPARFDSLRFRRYFKSTPELEHFYTANAQEGQSYAQAGYSYEGVEGYVFGIYKPGTVALYRYSWRNASNGDRERLYTITLNDPYAGGMRYDGIVGYVCTP